MAIKYGQKKQSQHNVIRAITTSLLLCAIFLTVVNYLYTAAEEKAYDDLHIQTKQIKDDLHLQLMSDRENLKTMASFAASLYIDGESYTRMLRSFKPIGLIENIGILNPDNTFVTKLGSLNLDGKISFEEEAAKGTYISGRMADLTKDNYEIIRSAVPITVDGRIVGILYGVIKLDTLGKKYNAMAKELDAQLFVYDKESGDLVIDGVNEELGNISFLKDREFNKGYSYEKMASEDKGFSSFKSKYRDENVYLHYSVMDDIPWGISLGRYESQVFAQTHTISKILLAAFLAMAIIMILYMLIVMTGEKRRNQVMEYSSEIRRLLLEVNQQNSNISNALKDVCLFSGARSAIFFDSDGEDYNYAVPQFEAKILVDKDRDFFMLKVFQYAAAFHRTYSETVNTMCITPDKHLLETNPEFYEFLKQHDIHTVSFASVIDEKNHISILGTVNPKKNKATINLISNIAVCFSIAIYNKKRLNKTETAVVTDALTGTLNRVAYNRDLLIFDEKRPENFTCIYIDVNELHLRNTKYGHAAGDEMLVYIANTLKEIFFGHKVYRIGGDEFLVFTEGISQDTVNKNIETLIEQLKQADYSVALGVSYREQNTNTDEMVREAEVRMYEAKAQYYQNKENKSVAQTVNAGYIQTKTGIPEVDALIRIMGEHYHGIYRVSLSTNKAHRILMPSYLGYSEDEEDFAKLYTKYVEEAVDPDFRRAMMSFLNYDAIRHQLMAGKTPQIAYKKINGDPVTLCVYKLDESEENAGKTLWFFMKG